MHHINIGDKKLVKLSYYRKQPYINLREYIISKEGTFVPTKKGILLTPDEWEKLKTEVTNIDDAVTAHIPTMQSKTVSNNQQESTMTSESTVALSSVETSSSAPETLKTPSKRASLSLNIQQPQTPTLPPKKRGRPFKSQKDMKTSDN